ncbi:hypothetical protein, partial [Microseira wollei]|uniref:hypothetical protein n=1 Tax=Microseira wollei TaxID=467598 RepID=UPI001CFC962E
PTTIDVRNIFFTRANAVDLLSALAVGARHQQYVSSAPRWWMPCPYHNRYTQYFFHPRQPGGCLIWVGSRGTASTICFIRAKVVDAVPLPQSIHTICFTRANAVDAVSGLAVGARHQQYVSSEQRWWMPCPYHNRCTQYFFHPRQRG